MAGFACEPRISRPGPRLRCREPGHPGRSRRTPGIPGRGSPMTMGIRLRRPLTVLAILPATLTLRPALRAEEPPRPPDAFEAADLGFRELYGQARAATLARFGPVIVVEMDQLI